MKNEIWRSVPGYETLLEVSNLGRVRKLNKDRSTTLLAIICENSAKIMPHVELNHPPNGCRDDLLVPNLVFSAFTGKDYNSVIYHIDKNRLNNSIDNLSDDPYVWPENADLAGEEWRPVKGYEGIYAVSSKGRLKTLGRVVAHKILGIQRRQQVIHSYTSDPVFDYICVGLWNNGKTKQRQLHRLVAEAFIPNPENKPQVNHKDGNKRNNCVENLEWCTTRENCLHAIRTGLSNADGKSKQVKSLTTMQIFPSIAAASRCTGITINSVRESLVRGKPYAGHQFVLVD